MDFELVLERSVAVAGTAEHLLEVGAPEKVEIHRNCRQMLVFLVLNGVLLFSVCSVRFVDRYGLEDLGSPMLVPRTIRCRFFAGSKVSTC